MNAKPILKWPGGKGWVVDRVAPLIQERLNKTRGRYIEPFVGGASMALAIQGENHLLTDACEELIETYETVRDNPVAVAETLESMAELGHLEAVYLRVRAEVPPGRVDRAARMIYLNRRGYNGLYRVNRKGEFNVPFGDTSGNLIDRERLIAFSNAIASHELAACGFEQALLCASDGDVIYADPPYDGTFDQYTADRFSDRDQVQLARDLSLAVERGATVIAHNSDTEFIRFLYKDWAFWPLYEARNVNREGDGRGKVKCLMIVGEPR